MAHFDDDENRFAKGILRGVDAATAHEINKSAQDLRKDIGALKTRLDQNEQSILAAVRKIAKRLDALESRPGRDAKAQALGAELASVTPAQRVELRQKAAVAVALGA